MAATAIISGVGMAAGASGVGKPDDYAGFLMNTESGRKTLLAIGYKDPKATPPAPTPIDQQQAVQDAANKQKAKLQQNQGRMSTILTSPTGLGTTDPKNLQYRTLLGQ